MGQILRENPNDPSYLLARVLREQEITNRMLAEGMHLNYEAYADQVDGVTPETAEAAVPTQGVATGDPRANPVGTENAQTSASEGSGDGLCPNL
jgi:hypothetical protein